MPTTQSGEIKKIHVPVKDLFPKKESTNRPTAQEWTKREGVFEGLLFRKNEDCSHKTTTCEGQKKRQKPKLPPQKKADGASQFHIAETNPLGFGQVKEKEKGKKQTPTEEFVIKRGIEKKGNHPQAIEGNGENIGNPPGFEVDEGNQKKNTDKN